MSRRGTRTSRWVSVRLRRYLYLPKNPKFVISSIQRHCCRTFHPIHPTPLLQVISSNATATWPSPNFVLQFCRSYRTRNNKETTPVPDEKH